MKVHYSNAYPVISTYSKQTSQYNNPTFNSYTFKPQGKPKFTKINPLLHYINDVFGRSLVASRRRNEPICKELKDYIKEVKIGKPMLGI